MSSAQGEVIHNGKVVGHFQYSGTADMAYSDMHPSPEALEKNWNRDYQHRCQCKQPPTDVLLWTNYGYGFYWPAQACLDCGVIVSGHDAILCDEEHGEWPKNGHPIHDAIAVGL